MPTITPNLWFDDNALDAAEFYVSVFPNSSIDTVTHYTAAGPGPEGSVLTVAFNLDGQPVVGINGGPMFSFTEAVSLEITCADQAEVDYYWDALTADGGQESMCAWLVDRFGLSWQIVPEALPRLLAGPDKAGAGRAMQAMLQMRKIVVADIEKAYAGT